MDVHCFILFVFKSVFGFCLGQVLSDSAIWTSRLLEYNNSLNAACFIDVQPGQIIRSMIKLIYVVFQNQSQLRSWLLSQVFWKAFWLLKLLLCQNDPLTIKTFCNRDIFRICLMQIKWLWAPDRLRSSFFDILLSFLRQNVQIFLTSWERTAFNALWSFPALLILKKDNTRKFCVDYRKLNEMTKRDPYPMPQLWFLDAWLFETASTLQVFWTWKLILCTWVSPWETKSSWNFFVHELDCLAACCVWNCSCYRPTCSVIYSSEHIPVPLTRGRQSAYKIRRPELEWPFYLLKWVLGLSLGLVHNILPAAWNKVIRPSASLATMLFFSLCFQCCLLLLFERTVVTTDASGFAI